VRLQGSIVEVDRLQARERDAMFQLLDGMFANVRRDAFDADLAAKQWVLRVHDPSTCDLVGFSTQVLFGPDQIGEAARVLYSGDTVVAREYWGDVALANVWGRLALDLIDRYRDEPLYWLLTSKGFRTYRYLPMFFHEWYPRRECTTPPYELQLIRKLGAYLSPHNFDPQSQVIIASAGKDFVRPGFSEPIGRAASDENVRYFLDRNPHYDRGDELCCLAPLTRENFTRAAYRVIASPPRHAAPRLSPHGACTS
jgi:hypothetical protein